MLPKIINYDQKGFIKAHYMGENIRLISDMMENAKAQNLSGILLSLDFKKAFDTLEWPYINKMLDTLNFGES